MGKKWEEFKDFSLGELSFVIEADLAKLAKRYSEMNCKLTVRPGILREEGEGLIVTLTASKCDAWTILRDDIDSIMGSYNKQLLVLRNGLFVSHYGRFQYGVEFDHKPLSVIKGGYDG